MGASIIDAIDTLWIMDMKEEYEDAKKWIELNLDFKRLSVIFFYFFLEICDNSEKHPEPIMKKNPNLGLNSFIL